MIMKNDNKNGMLRLIIPGMLLISILMAGCWQTTATEMPPKPAKPTLNTEPHPECERGICLDGENTYRLLDYIWQLEEGYE